MSKLTQKSPIKILNETYEAGDLLKTLIYFKAELVKEFFQSRGLSIPRKLRMASLRQVVKDRVPETRKERLTLADELNYRLSWFDEYTELQLENLVAFYNDTELEKQYFEQLWLDLLSYMMERGISQDSLDSLRLNSIDYVKQNGLVLPDFKNYNRTLDELFFDIKGQIDGLTVEKIRPVLYKSSTLTEIRELGTKYGVNVPRRLKKNELADIIIAELKDQGDVSVEEETRIRNMNVIVMQRFAINHNIKASTELKKEEIIEYVLKNAQETRETYFVPEASVYDVEVEQVKTVEPVQEEVVEETLVVEETQPEEVVEEKPVIEEEIAPVKEVIIEKVIEQQPVIVQADHSKIAEEIRLLRETVAQVFTVEDALETKNVSEAVVLDGADFQGDKKAWKRANKEEKNAANEQGFVLNDIRQPVPVYAVSGRKANKRNGFVTFLKFLMWLIIILIAILLIYSVVTHFVDLPSLQGVTDAINSVKLGSKGIIEHIHDFLSSLGL